MAKENTAAIAAARGLLTAAAVRERAGLVLAAGLAGKLQHFLVHETRLPAVADYVAETIRTNYPFLVIPPHARWRHFVVDGIDRWAAMARELPTDRAERTRVRFDLAVTSVLLDAGAGAAWRWQDPMTGKHVGRSEGLALASLEAFRAGLFSSDAKRPWRANSERLKRISTDDLERAFQVTATNRLAGLEGRVVVLNRLGHAIENKSDLFGADKRIGGLFDTLIRRASDGHVAAPDILMLLLEALGSIWPNRATLGGIALGDTWRHPAVRIAGPTNGLIPFHKLSQWLAYSLIEPIEEAGYPVDDIDGLTGLAEYRNGGLFLDLGAVEARHEDLFERELTPADEPVIEWRALTVALIDQIAPLVRTRLGRDARTLPLAALLEGGTWSAGRRIAAEKRADGAPPLRIISDGSVF